MGSSGWPSGLCFLVDRRLRPSFGSTRRRHLLARGLLLSARDLLVSATVRTHIAIREAGSIADLLVLEGVAHGAYANPLDSPESRLAYADLNRFVLEHLS